MKAAGMYDAATAPEIRKFMFTMLRHDIYSSVLTRTSSRREKYPFGYPGDEFGPNSFPVYECIQCRDLYPIGAQHGTPCESCGCLMSAISQRARPRAVLPRADPSLLEVIRGRINAVGA